MGGGVGVGVCFFKILFIWIHLYIHTRIWFLHFCGIRVRNNDQFEYRLAFSVEREKYPGCHTTQSCNYFGSHGTRNGVARSLNVLCPTAKKFTPRYRYHSFCWIGIEKIRMDTLSLHINLTVSYKIYAFHAFL